MPFFVVFHGNVPNHPLHPRYTEPSVRTQGFQHVIIRGKQGPIVNGEPLRDFTISGAEFSSCAEAEAALAAANAQLPRAFPATIVEAEDEVAGKAAFSGDPPRRWLKPTDEAFLAPVRAALAQHGELLVWYEPPDRGGRDIHWYRIHTEAELRQIVATGGRGWQVTVFLEPQLPVRGVADAATERTVLERWPTDEEVQGLVCGVQVSGQLELADVLELPDDRADLHAWFQRHQAETIAIGPSPGPWQTTNDLDEKAHVWEVVPDEHGKQRNW